MVGEPDGNDVLLIIGTGQFMKSIIGRIGNLGRIERGAAYQTWQTPPALLRFAFPFAARDRHMGQFLQDRDILAIPHHLAFRFELIWVENANIKTDLRQDTLYASDKV